MANNITSHFGKNKNITLKSDAFNLDRNFQWTVKGFAERVLPCGIFKFFALLRENLITYLRLERYFQIRKFALLVSGETKRNLFFERDCYVWDVIRVLKSQCSTMLFTLGLEDTPLCRFHRKQILAEFKYRQASTPNPQKMLFFNFLT